MASLYHCIKVVVFNSIVFGSSTWPLFTATNRLRSTLIVSKTPFECPISVKRVCSTFMRHPPCAIEEMEKNTVYLEVVRLPAMASAAGWLSWRVPRPRTRLPQPRRRRESVAVACCPDVAACGRHSARSSTCLLTALTEAEVDQPCLCARYRPKSTPNQLL